MDAVPERTLLPVDEALDLVVAEASVLAPEQVALNAAPGRVLAVPVHSDVDVPPFDRCAMDGWAVRSVDVVDAPTSLRVAGSIAAGESFAGEVGAGQTVKVMTGAPLPRGCDAVQPVERVRDEVARVVIYDPVPAGQHVSPRAEDLEVGDQVLPAGTLIGPTEVGLLATVGQAEVTAHARPLATVVSTGDELVEVGESPRAAQLRNSNGPMLAVLARTLGCDPVHLMPVVRDDEEELRTALGRGLQSDILLVSGGVSKGDRDHVGDVLGDLGVRCLFHGVAIQPGKPIWFGKSDRCLVFGLPGNPVSALVTGHVFAGTAVRKLRGVADPRPRRMPARLASAVRRRSARAGFLPARVEAHEGGLTCHPLDTHGSADLVSVSRSNATWIAPAGRHVLEAGEAVQVLLHADFAER